MTGDGKNRVDRRPIVLVGFMAVGKTTVGRLLARRLHLPFIDSDREIEQDFGCSVAEIFERHGEDLFRAAERDLVLRLAAGAAAVIALGGGAFCDPRVRTLVNDHAISVWLDPPVELILERLAGATDRPLASGKSGDALRKLWRERRRSYAAAHVHLETSDSDPSQAVERILESLPVEAT
jgi:shikimate kinase